MKKSQIVTALIENTEWTEADREFLMGMTDERLAKLIPRVDNEESEEDEDPTEDDEDDDDEEGATKNEKNKVVPITKNNKKEGKKTSKKVKNKKSKDEDEDEEEVPVANEEEDSLSDYLKKAPSHIRAVLNHGVKAHNAEIKRLIKIITSNEACTFNPEFLRTKDLEELQVLAKMAQNSHKDENEYEGVSFFGAAGGPATRVSNETVKPMGVPQLSFDNPFTSK